MGISAQQRLVGEDSSALVVFLELRTRGFIHRIVCIVGLGITLDELTHHVYLLIVFMLQSQRISPLEKRIVGTGSLQLAYLRVVTDGLRELTVVEIAVTDAVQRVRVRRVCHHRGVDIGQERITRLVVVVLREIAVPLQVPRDGVVGGILGVALREELIQVLLAGEVVAQPVVCLTPHVIRLGRVFGRLFSVIDHLGHPVRRLLHLALQEVIRTQLITQIQLRLFHLRCRLGNRV